MFYHADVPHNLVIEVSYWVCSKPRVDLAIEYYKAGFARRSRVDPIVEYSQAESAREPRVNPSTGWKRSMKWR